MTTYTSRPLRPDLVELLQKLKAGQRVRIKHLVRVGFKTWPVEVTGTFRHVDSLATGLATHRDPHDDIIVAMVHFTKDNGELSSIALDEHTNIDILV